jgi:hypothetical protein
MRAQAKAAIKDAYNGRVLCTGRFCKGCLHPRVQTLAESAKAKAAPQPQAFGQCTTAPQSSPMPHSQSIENDAGGPNAERARSTEARSRGRSPLLQGACLLPPPWPLAGPKPRVLHRRRYERGLEWGASARNAVDRWLDSPHAQPHHWPMPRAQGARSIKEGKKEEAKKRSPPLAPAGGRGPVKK